MKWMKWRYVKCSEVTWRDVKCSEVKQRVRSQFTRLPLLVQLTTSLCRSSSTGISWIPSGRTASENDLWPCRQFFTDMRDVQRVSKSCHCLRCPDSISKLLCLVLRYVLKTGRLPEGNVLLPDYKAKREWKIRKWTTARNSYDCTAIT